jgi:hypothetical protein
MFPHNVEAVNVLRIEMDPQVSSTSCQAHAKVKIWIIRMCSKLLWKKFSPAIQRPILFRLYSRKTSVRILRSTVSGLQSSTAQCVLTSIATPGHSLRKAQ